MNILIAFVRVKCTSVKSVISKNTISLTCINNEGLMVRNEDLVMVIENDYIVLELVSRYPVSASLREQTKMC